MGLRRFFPILCLALALVLVGCGQKDPVESIMPSSKASCGGRAINDQYLVQWYDGTVELVKEDSPEKFKEAFVRPQLEKIQRIEFNQVFSAQDFSDVEFSPQAVTSIDNWGFRNVNVASFWQKNIRGAGVVVAVVDSGVDINHSLLASRIEHNSGESGSLASNGIDDDHNGYVDDYSGFSFYDHSNDLTDNVFHGTHVSGVIAGHHTHTSVVDNELIGMAPEAKILPVKFLDEDGGSLAAAIEAIDYATSRGAKIINASWGGNGCSEILRDKVNSLEGKDILFVVAAGNSGSNLDFYPEFPAAFVSPAQITVGAISPFLGMTPFSNYSKTLVHLFAPGKDIVSSIPGDKAMALSGTSMAAPFVSGAAALIWAAEPGLTVAEVRAKILSAVTVNNNYSNATHGRIDLAVVANTLP